MLHLFWYGVHANKEHMRAPYDPKDKDWLREMPTLGSGGGGGRPACDDSNVACDEGARWRVPPAVPSHHPLPLPIIPWSHTLPTIPCRRVPPASSPYGARFPVRHFWPPRYPLDYLSITS